MDGLLLDGNAMVQTMTFGNIAPIIAATLELARMGSLDCRAGVLIRRLWLTSVQPRT